MRRILFADPLQNTRCCQILWPPLSMPMADVVGQWRPIDPHWGMLARIYATTSFAVGYSTVVVKMESRACGEDRRERLMSTSSVFNRPYFSWSLCSPAKSGRESAHGHGRNLRQTVSSQLESLHSSHSKPPPGSRPTPSLTRHTRFLALSTP